MSRPRKMRRICMIPKNRLFLPANKCDGSAIILSLDEFESIRLIDKERMSQEECAAVMQVARTTVQQIYTCARQKLASALTDGKAIKIEGGDYCLCERMGECPCCRRRAKISKSEDLQ